MRKRFMDLLLILSLSSLTPVKAYSQLNQPDPDFIDWLDIEEPDDDATLMRIASAAEDSWFTEDVAEESLIISRVGSNLDIDFDYFEEPFNETAISQLLEFCPLPNVGETTYNGDLAKNTVLPVSTNVQYSQTISAAINKSGSICMLYIRDLYSPPTPPPIKSTTPKPEQHDPPTPPNFGMLQM